MTENTVDNNMNDNNMNDNNINDSNIDTNSNKKVVVLALQGDNFSSKFIICWTNALNSLWHNNKYDFIISNGDSSFTPYSRMKSLGLSVLKGISQKPFSGLKFDYWISIDSNILFTPEQIIEIIDSLDVHPVVSALYKNDTIVNYAAVKNLDANYFIKNGNYEYITQDFIDNWKNETNLKYMPIAYSGLGFIGIKSEVLHAMTYPYFNSELIEMANEDGTIIRFLPSEDISLCKNIKNLGYEIMLNTDLRVGTIKNLVI